MKERRNPGCARVLVHADKGTQMTFIMIFNTVHVFPWTLLLKCLIRSLVGTEPLVKDMNHIWAFPAKTHQKVCSEQSAEEKKYFYCFWSEGRSTHHDDDDHVSLHKIVFCSSETFLFQSVLLGKTFFICCWSCSIIHISASLKLSQAALRHALKSFPARSPVKLGPCENTACQPSPECSENVPAVLNTADSDNLPLRFLPMRMSNSGKCPQV